MRFDKKLFFRGLKDGIPICLGYLSVSFAFGMMAVESGMSPWTALIISMSNMTSAGQVAGVELIMNGGTYLEILAATIVINLRYTLMSLSLSQKLDEKMSKIARILLPFGNTDEIFAVAMQQEGAIKASYLFGLIVTPYVGWSVGTILGATMMSLLPAMLRSALGLALYGRFGGGTQYCFLLYSRTQSSFRRLGYYHLCRYSCCSCCDTPSDFG